MPSGQSSGRGISTGSATLELFDAFSRLLHEIPVDDLPGQELLLYFADLGWTYLMACAREALQPPQPLSHQQARVALLVVTR
jgi:hypothetical protein